MVSKAVLSILILLGLGACVSPPRNPVLDYLSGAEAQYDSQEQKANIVAALTDALTLSQATLRERRYADYAGNPGQWDLPTLLYRHFVPARQGTTLGHRFYRDVQAREVRARIAEILAQMQTETSG